MRERDSVCKERERKGEVKEGRVSEREREQKKIEKTL